MPFVKIGKKTKRLHNVVVKKILGQRVNLIIIGLILSGTKLLFSWSYNMGYVLDLN